MTTSPQRKNPLTIPLIMFIVAVVALAAVMVLGRNQLNGQITDLNAELTELTSSMQTLASDLETASAQRDAAEASVVALTEEKTNLTAQVESITAELTAAQDELTQDAAAIAILTEEKAALTAQVESITAELTAAQDKLAEDEAAIAALNGEKAALVQNIAELTAAQEELAQKLGTVMIPYGSFRVPVPTGWSSFTSELGVDEYNYGNSVLMLCPAQDAEMPESAEEQKAALREKLDTFIQGFIYGDKTIPEEAYSDMANEHGIGITMASTLGGTEWKMLIYYTPDAPGSVLMASYLDLDGIGNAEQVLARMVEGIQAASTGRK